MEFDDITEAKMALLRKEIETQYGKEVSSVVASAMTGAMATILFNSRIHEISATDTLAAFIKVVRGLDDMVDEKAEQERRAKFN